VVHHLRVPRRDRHPRVHRVKHFVALRNSHKSKLVHRPFIISYLPQPQTTQQNHQRVIIINQKQSRHAHSR
jgi:hypothetical protein